jgi:uncharacterized protein (DUF488 family)
MIDTLNPIFTVGHSRHELEHFVKLLTLNGVTALADVRSSPFSRVPHFNRDALAAAVRGYGIKYVPLGRELGARREEGECYVDGQAVYELVAKLPLFREGIDRLIRGARDHVIALMCSEKEPLDCHRAVLVCRHLRFHGLQISHIHADGRLESHRELERRLMTLMGMSPRQGELFAGEQQLIEQAYEAKGGEIAWRVGAEGVTGKIDGRQTGSPMSTISAKAAS